MNERKVLIIDDDIDMLRLLSRQLGPAGFTVVRAQDGATALTVARRERPSAIVLDLGLPGGDGMTVLDRLGKNRELAEVPVLVLTSKGPSVESRAREAGASVFLRKPAEPSVLIEKLESLLGACGESTPDGPPPGPARAGGA